MYLKFIVILIIVPKEYFYINYIIHVNFFYRYIPILSLISSIIKNNKVDFIQNNEFYLANPIKFLTILQK